jgi:hypothetical protein
MEFRKWKNIIVCVSWISHHCDKIPEIINLKGWTVSFVSWFQFMVTLPNCLDLCWHSLSCGSTWLRTHGSQERKRETQKSRVSNIFFKGISPQWSNFLPLESTSKYSTIFLLCCRWGPSLQYMDLWGIVQIHLIALIPLPTSKCSHPSHSAKCILPIS